MLKNAVFLVLSVFTSGVASMAVADVLTEPRTGFQVELPKDFSVVRGRSGFPGAEYQRGTKYIGITLIGVPPNGPKLKDARSEPDFTSHMGFGPKIFMNETEYSIDIESISYNGDDGAEMVVRHLHEVQDCEGETALAMVEFFFFDQPAGTKEEFVQTSRARAHEIISSLKPCK